MARNIKRIAKKLGAEVVARVPETGGGAFGAARVAAIVATFQQRLKPSNGRRPGRPTMPHWERHPKIPMSRATERKLKRLAERASTTERKVSPMQLAAQILEEAVASCPDE